MREKGDWRTTHQAWGEIEKIIQAQVSLDWQARDVAAATAREYERAQADMFLRSLPSSDLPVVPVGEPGFWEGVIPVWGSGRAAINDFQAGHPIWGTVNTVFAISDVFLVKSIATGAGKLIWKTGARFVARDVVRTAEKEAVRLLEKKAAAEIPGALRKLIAEAERRYPKLAGLWEWHHTWPFEFGPPPDIYWRFWAREVRLPAAYHRLITNEIRAGLRALGRNPTPAQLWELLQRVYTKYPINRFAMVGGGQWW